jgi:hypothetical protein
MSTPEKAKISIDALRNAGDNGVLAVGRADVSPGGPLDPEGSQQAKTLCDVVCRRPQLLVEQDPAGADRGRGASQKAIPWMFSKTSKSCSRV